MEEELTKLFIFVDDFCNIFEPIWDGYRISEGINRRIRKHELCLSEMMTILIFFHISGFKCLKICYQFLHKSHKNEFPNLVSYNRFIELQETCVGPLLVLFSIISGQCNGQSFIDSTALPIRHIKREFSHKTFFGLAKKSKSTMGWFFGFKLHLIINSHAQPISFMVTEANVDDRKVPDNLFEKIFGKLFGDKGYLGKEFFNRMKDKMVQVVTAIRSNMKPQLIPIWDSEQLNKRSLVETTFSVLKTRLNLQHTRHRSPKNFLINIVGLLCAYCFRFVGGFNAMHKYLDAVH